MDLNQCIRVCEADPITNHQHSILIAFKNEQHPQGDENKTPVKSIAKESAIGGSAQQHPVVCYVKADSTEEIRWYVL